MHNGHIFLLLQILFAQVRIRLLFKLAVEADMTMNVVAGGFKVSDDKLKQLRARCVQEVKKTGGTISFEDAVKYQRGK